MATTLRMNRQPKPEMDTSALPHRRVHISSVGSFGRAVARYLKHGLPDASHEERRGGELATELPWSDSRIHVVASWKPVPRLCATVNDLCFTRSAAFIPLILDSTLIRLGPIILPGESGCWHCWTKRQQQHEAHPAEQAARLDFYEQEPETAPKGFLEPLALLGAAMVLRVVSDDDRELRSAAGTIWSMNVFTREVGSGRLVGIDACKWCGLHRSVGDRTHGEMRMGLADLWPHDPSSSVESLGNCSSLEGRKH